MPRKLGAFTVPDCQRIKQVVRTVEGSPRSYLRVPERVPRHVGGGGGTATDGLASPWTICEYDAVTGDRLRGFDRGWRRTQSATLRDWDVVMSADGAYLYAVGMGHINRNTGLVVKWNASTGERVWDSSKGAFSGPLYGPGTAGSAGAQMCELICEASDGYIWAFGTDTANHCVGRYDPDTGAQTHKFALATHTSVYAVRPLTSGSVLVVANASSGSHVYVLDSTATQVASYATGIQEFVLSPDMTKIAISHASGTTNNMRILDIATLTTQDQRSSPGSSGVYRAFAWDGTTIYTVHVTGSTWTYRAYDSTNLATELWNGAKEATNGTTIELVYESGALWDFSEHTRKISATDGSETWESPSTGIAPSITPLTRKSCAIGSDFLMVTTATGTNESVYCLEKSNGTVRWYDQWDADDAKSVIVSDDDRVFVCGGRTGP